MKYLIDTDISSFFLRGKHNLLEVFETKGFQNIKLSIITVAELEVLALRNPYSKINSSTINQLSQKLGVLDIDRETWRIFSQMKAQTLFIGKPRGDFDILIASIAKQHRLIVVTNNTSHYADLIDVENWID